MDTDLDGTQVLVANSIVVPQQPTNLPTPAPEAVEVAPLKHICDICSKGFPSGQALGGHKSMHFRESEAITNATPSITNLICCLLCGDNVSKTEILSHTRCHNRNSSATVSDETMFDDGVDSGSMAMTLPAGASSTGKRERAATSDCSGSVETAVKSSPQLESAIVEEFSGSLVMLAEVCSEEAAGKILVDDDDIEEYNKRRKLNDAADQLDDHCNNHIDVLGSKLCDNTFTSHQALGGHTSSLNRPKINSADHSHDNDPVVNAYNCSDCDRSFSSHQALGGHISSHKKNKNKNNTDRDQSNSADMSAGSAEDNKIEPHKLCQTVPHQCEVCLKDFPTGQALGGHKRLHYKGPTEAQAKPSQQSSSHRHLDIDLNELPPIEDEDGIYDPSLFLKLN